MNMEFTKPTIQHHEIIACDYDKELMRTVTRLRWDPYKNEPFKDIDDSVLAEVVKRI